MALAPQTKERGKRVDVFHYHHVWDGYFKSTWGEARRLFGEIMAEPASEINYVTVLRDPVEHWLSYFYFYFQPEMKVCLFCFGGEGAKRFNDINRLGVREIVMLVIGFCCFLPNCCFSVCSAKM